MLTGRVGAGKTTLLLVLLGLLPRQRGSVRGTAGRWPSRECCAPPRARLHPAGAPPVQRVAAGQHPGAGSAGAREARPGRALRLAGRWSRTWRRWSGGWRRWWGPEGCASPGARCSAPGRRGCWSGEPELLVVDDLSSALDVETERRLWERLLGDGERGGQRRGRRWPRTARRTAGRLAVLAVSHRRRPCAGRHRSSSWRGAGWWRRGRCRPCSGRAPRCAACGRMSRTHGPQRRGRGRAAPVRRIIAGKSTGLQMRARRGRRMGYPTAGWAHPTAGVCPHDGHPDHPSVLSDALLERFRERAATYDRENRFFDEDFDELRDAGYLNLAVPRDLGGPGLTLAEVGREQRRLAYYAPATALAVNMHLYWTGARRRPAPAGRRLPGVAPARGGRRGRSSPPGTASAATTSRCSSPPPAPSGSRPGRTASRLPLLGAQDVRQPDPGLDAPGDPRHWAAPEGPQIVHAFLPRDTPGYEIKETWDTLGMRATRSDDTILDGAFVPDRYIARMLPGGAARTPSSWASSPGPWWASPTSTTASPAGARPGRGGGPQAHLAGRLPLDGLPPGGAARGGGDDAGPGGRSGPSSTGSPQDWAAGVDHGARWPMKIVAAKHNAWRRPSGWSTWP